MTHIDALEDTKLQLLLRRDIAFFGILCLSTKFEWDTNIAKVKTDGLSIKLNPEFFSSIPEKYRLYHLLHPVVHIGLMHMLRKGDREENKWLAACDYAVNNVLKDSKIDIPPDALFNEKFTDLPAEDIYDLLEDDEESQTGESDMEMPSSGNSPGESSNGIGGSKSFEEIQTKVLQNLLRADTQAKMSGSERTAGQFKGEFEFLVGKLLNPELPWNQILAKYMAKYTKSDYSWKRPSRRFFPAHYLPSMYSTSIVDLCFAVDASGSVSDEDFKRFISEIQGVIKLLKPSKTTLIQFDTAIQSIDVLKNTRDLSKVKFRGRGGTDVNPVMEWVNENKPKVTLVFTDGELYRKPIKANTDLVWLIHNNTSFQAEQGKIIHYTLP